MYTCVLHVVHTIYFPNGYGYNRSPNFLVFLSTSSTLQKPVKIYRLPRVIFLPACSCKPQKDVIVPAVLGELILASTLSHFQFTNSVPPPSKSVFNVMTKHKCTLIYKIVDVINGFVRIVL